MMEINLFLLYCSTLIALSRGACVPNQLRLYNGKASNEGMLQMCTSGGYWAAVCHHPYWDCRDMQVACTQLGYTKSKPITFSPNTFGSYPHIQQGAYHCAGNEKTLQNCAYSTGWWYWHYYCNQYRLVSMACDVIVDERCKNGDLRLVGGKTTNEGRPEYCYNGTWTPLCSLDQNTAAIACRQLGYRHYTWSKVFYNGEFGQSSRYSLVNRIYCSSDRTEENLLACRIDDSCGAACPNKNIGLRCYNPGSCNENTVRLANGTYEQEGRVEICVNGVWGTICDYYWEPTDGYILCKQMGFQNSHPTAYYHSYFGSGYGPIVYSHLHCRGWEKDINDCNHYEYGQFNCPQNRVAGLLCRESCVEGALRLVGGDVSTEGTVEICLDKLWGLVAANGWGDKDAVVVCRQLNYGIEDAKGLNGSVFGKPRRPVHLNNVYCNGREERLTECSAFKLLLKNGRNILEHVEVAGVRCHKPDNTMMNVTVPIIHPTPNAVGHQSNPSFSTMDIIVIVLIALVCMLILGTLVVIGIVVYTKKKAKIALQQSEEPVIAPPTNVDTQPLYAAPSKRARRFKNLVEEDEQEDFMDADNL